MTNRWSVLALVLLLLLQGCRRDEEGIAFCQLGTDSDRAGRVYFDLANKVAFAGDTRSSLEPVRTGQFIGFTSPFPIMAPASDILRKGEPVSWTADGYAFTAVPQTPQGGKWFLITATKTEDLKAADASITTLYSIDSGVIAYKRTVEADGRTFESEYHICGQGKLLLTDLAQPAR